MKLKPEQKAVIDEIQSEIAYHQRIFAELNQRLNIRLSQYARVLGVDIQSGDFNYVDGEFVRWEEGDGTVCERKTD